MQHAQMIQNAQQTSGNASTARISGAADGHRIDST
jgi:hypothetical protein